jgi:hypothetical protein
LDKGAFMSGRVRVQLQQSHDNIDSLTPRTISSAHTLAALAKLLANNKRYKNDRKWEKEPATAIAKVTDWVKRIQKAGEFKPRGGGTAYSQKFKYEGDEYRIDLETNGTDTEWFK